MRQRLSEYEDPEPSERPRRLPRALLTVAAMAVFAGGLWFAYQQGARNASVSPAASSDKVPLIRADERPTKVKPDQPGGMDVPDRDKLVFTGKPTGPAVEKLLPPAEQPRPVPPPAPPQPAPPMGAMLTPVGPAPLSPSAPAGNDAAPKSAKPGAAPAAKAPAWANGIRIQLGSVRSAEAAREEWSRLKQANPDVLGKLSAVAVRADLGDKGIYYRIQAGPLADAATGDHLCSELKKRNLGCTLVR
jgi:hypothetical protein